MNNNNIYEGKKYENHELKQLELDFEEYLLENPDVSPFFMGRVESNPFGEGGDQDIWFGLDGDGLTSFFPKQHNIDGVDYAWSYAWTNGACTGSITITKLPK